jgi:hypothetical protein
MLCALLCPEKSTLTNLICTGGRQQQDWSAAYRLYSQERVDERVLFSEVRDQVIACLPPQEPLVVAIDDTLVRKRGALIHGVSWRRDPLGPPFQTNLVRGQRFIQFSAAWPLEEGRARMVPIGFFHAPSAAKAPKDADAGQLQAHREQQKQRSLNAQALCQMGELRGQCDPSRPIVFNGDGSYTNATVLKGLPAQSTYIGRIRKDAKLHELPGKSLASTGRRPSYGPLAPTPEELRIDEQTPWQQVDAFAAGKRHQFRIKTLGPVLWRKSGAALPLRVIVIAPLGYRLRAGAKLLYRQPAFIICSDPQMSLEKVLQYYLWRWGIEVNFREEKSLIGAGQAQVRTEASNTHLPAVIVAAYALLWVSALRLRQRGAEIPWLQPPKWRRRSPQEHPLPSTGDLLRTLRFEIWSAALRPASFYDFVTASPTNTKLQKPAPSLPSMLFAAA